MQYSNLIKYFKNSYVELIEKTTWISWIKAQKTSYMAVIVFILFSLLIFVMDKFFQGLLETIFEQF